MRLLKLVFDRKNEKRAVKIVEKSAEPKELMDIVVYDSDEKVKMDAFNKLIDQEYINKIIKTTDEEALLTIIEIYGDLAQSSFKEAVCALLEIYRQKKNAKFRNEISKYRIVTDGNKAYYESLSEPGDEGSYPDYFKESIIGNVKVRESYLCLYCETELE